MAKTYGKDFTGVEIREAIGDEHEDLEIVEDGEWEVEHKYQTSYSILHEVSTDKYYYLDRMRYGNYYEGYEESFDNNWLPEVKKVTKQITVTKWEQIEEEDK
jgi:hypothetical protein